MKKGIQVTVSSDSFDAVIFDLDGVVTDTASIHAGAWKKMFDDFLFRYPTAKVFPSSLLKQTRITFSMLMESPGSMGYGASSAQGGLNCPKGGRRMSQALKPFTVWAVKRMHIF